jgi:Carboxypeptidase regulatory-like domain
MRILAVALVVGCSSNNKGGGSPAGSLDASQSGDASQSDDAATSDGASDARAPDGGDATVPSGSGVLAGLVTDVQTGGALAGVAVSAGTASTSSDANGRYTLTGLPVGPLVVTLTLSAYAPGYVDVNVGSTPAAAMTSLKAEGALQPYDPTQGGTISQTTSNGPYAVIFTPGVLDTTDTALKVSVTPLDPTAEIRALPGNLSTPTALLEPLTFAEFSIFDSTGARVNLKSGSEAIVELPIPLSLRAVADFALGKTIHCYSYDPATGQWEDFVVGTVTTSSVDGSTPVLRASVKHFSWYGGAPEASVCVQIYGKVVTQSGVPVPGATVVATPGSSGVTDANGLFSVLVATTGGYVPTLTALLAEPAADASPAAIGLQYGQVSTGPLAGLPLVACTGLTDAAAPDSGAGPGSSTANPVVITVQATAASPELNPLADAGACFDLASNAIGQVTQVVPFTVGDAGAAAAGGTLASGTYRLTAQIYSSPCYTADNAGQPGYGNAALLQVTAATATTGTLTLAQLSDVGQPGSVLLTQALVFGYTIQGTSLVITQQCLGAVGPCGFAGFACDGGPVTAVTDAGLQLQGFPQGSTVEVFANANGDAGTSTTSFTASGNQIVFYSPGQTCSITDFFSSSM